MTFTYDSFLARLLRLVSRETTAEQPGYVQAPPALQYPMNERTRRMMQMARARSL